MNLQTHKQPRDERGLFTTKARTVLTEVEKNIDTIIKEDKPNLDFIGAETIINIETPKPETNKPQNQKGKDKRQIAIESLVVSIVKRIWPIMKSKNFIIGFVIATLLAIIF